MTTKQIALFERMTLQQALDQTAASLNAYGKRYDHWAIAYSGGKDSTATVAAVVYLIKTGQVKAPRSLTILYADTRQELPPLRDAPLQMMNALEQRGIRVIRVLPPMDDRYMVYILGRGVPPPNNATLRWCTEKIKIKPMDAALQALSNELGGQKFLLLTGVREGESAARDGRITASCSRNGAECGQGWFQIQPPKSASDTLAPILHWRVCHVWEFLTFWTRRHGLPTQFVAEAYGGDEAEEINARTGCIGCPLASKETALETILKLPQWAYLAPLRELKPLYKELRDDRSGRLRKDGERNKDGKLSSNPNRLGPLTMERRRYGLWRVIDIQYRVNEAADRLGRPRIDLISNDEITHILAMHDNNVWPQKWTGDEPTGDQWIELTIAEGVVQPSLFV